LKDGTGIIGEPSSVKCLTSPVPQIVSRSNDRAAVSVSLDHL